jgi:hypothetical protein
MTHRVRLLSALVLAGALATVLATGASVARAADAGSASTPDGHPDLSGTYDVATLTPLTRPAKFGDKAFLTREEADKVAAEEKALMAAANRQSDPNRTAPPDGGDGSEGASGNVGGYNAFWIDRGSAAFEIDGKFATSILLDPVNGQFPPMTPEAAQKAAAQRSQFRENRGDAWWLNESGPGPYDDMETRGLGERCLLGFGSAGGPPMLPVLYNNMKKIVQTPGYVMILVEMVHDARIVRLGQEHLPASVRGWMGDSVGRWEGDTLVIDTANFNDTPALRQADRNLHVVERFTRLDSGHLRYRFTVEDPTVWTASWTGEYVWPATSERVFEYACHEGNYALGNIMRGARLLEAEALAKTTKNP